MRKLLGFCCVMLMACVNHAEAMAQKPEAQQEVAQNQGYISKTETTTTVQKTEEVAPAVAAPAVVAPVVAAPEAVVAAPAAPAMVQPVKAMAVKPAAYDFGDYKSSTLASKAWAALAKNDIEAVLAYTNKCIDMYGAKAKEMQASLKDYVTGSNDDIFKMWALNDVATSYFIQGEAYRQANMKDEAKEAFNKVINDVSFGQVWDTKGWFWKPADAAKEKITMIESGVNLDFGDYSSSTLVSKAWAALAANDLNAVIAYVNKTTSMYGAKAKEMQASLKDYAAGSNDEIFKNWALNDVGTALFILGEAYRTAGNKDEAIKAYKQVVDEYTYAQCWDQGGWFWKPSEGAQKKIGELENS
ncbi:MAG: tetratricopeptide repeat protein [Candidatus Omnitrophica bacterium]|nr:tetratricopeptide repeat protein [Candidatus Omnitrophota bacterium]